MPGLLETIVALCALSLFVMAATDEDAPALDDAALASVWWL